MLELLKYSITGINLIPTILLVFVLIYWLIVIMGVMDMDALDFDLEADLDIDADVDVDGEVELGGFASVLTFFNIGQMPFMVFVTFFVLPLWAITILVNDWFGNYSWLIGIPILIGSFIASLFVAKILTTPLARFFKKVKENTEAVNVIGQICTAKFPITNKKNSQAEVKSEGTSVLITVKTREGIIEKGGTGLVIDFDESRKVYYVEPYQI